MVDNKFGLAGKHQTVEDTQELLELLVRSEFLN